MNDSDSRPPVDLHLDRPHSARIYDYFLGGKNHYAADRIAAEEIEKAFPSVRLASRTNRDFMHRATRFHAEQGIRQFLDIGTGIPTEPNLHQIAQEITPDARVVYTDNDPIVVAHARALMVGTPEGRLAYIHADATQPESILTAKRLLDTLDLTRPVALSLIALAHYMTDNAYDAVSTLMDALAPGSYLAMTHSTADFDLAANMWTKNSTVEEYSLRDAPNATKVYQESGGSFRLRTREEFARFFTGLELVDPGITAPHRWRHGIEPPQGTDAKVSLHAAVGKKP